MAGLDEGVYQELLYGIADKIVNHGYRWWPGGQGSLSERIAELELVSWPLNNATVLQLLPDQFLRRTQEEVAVALYRLFRCGELVAVCHMLSARRHV